MKSKLLLILLLLPCLAGATNKILTNGDLPYTVGSEDTVIINSALTTTGNGIDAAGTNGKVIYFQSGGSLKFGTGGSAGAWGINVSTASVPVSCANNLKIVGQTGSETIYNDSTLTSVSQIGIYGFIQPPGTPVCSNIVIYDITIKVWGNGSHCINVMHNDYVNNSKGFIDCRLSNCDLWNNSDRYPSRGSYDGSAVLIWQYTKSSSGLYNWIIDSNTIHLTPGPGFMLNGVYYEEVDGGVYHIFDNDITVDTRNENYPYSPSGSGQTYNGTGNAYAIFCRSVRAPTKIHGNTIQSGTNYGGGRGIGMEMCHGNSSEWIEIYNNILDMHECCDPTYGEQTACFGIRIRSEPGNPYNQIDHFKIYNNTVTVTGNTDESVDSYGPNNRAFEISRASGNDTTSYLNIHIYNNTFKGEVESGTPALHGAYFYVYGIPDGDTSNHFYNNRIESPNKIIHWDDVDGDSSFTMTGCTLNITSSPYSAKTFTIDADVTIPIVLREMTYEGTADDDDYTLGASKLTFQELARCFVMGNNDSLVANATVRIVNNYSDTVVTANTGDSGIGSGYASYHFDIYSGTDSLPAQYNDFTMWAISGTDSNYITTTIINPFHSDTVTLLNTAGTIPPSAPEAVNVTIFKGVKLKGGRIK